MKNHWHYLLFIVSLLAINTTSVVSIPIIWNIFNQINWLISLFMKGIDDKILDVISTFFQVQLPGNPSEALNAYLSMEQIVRSNGYFMESHSVETDDGYILEIFRISNEKNTSSIKIPVLLMHGFTSTSEIWIANNYSLGYVLAEIKYDVWIGNLRGNEFGVNHTTLSLLNKEFWDFSFDQHASYDLPATIDYILYKTNNKQLYYIGHSMGTTSVFALLASKTEYNKKIKGVVALAPLTNTKYTTTVLRELEFDLELALIPYYPRFMIFTVSQQSRSAVINRICFSSNSSRQCCKQFFNFIMGHNENTNDYEFSTNSILQVTASGSSKQFYHYSELLATEQFNFFDEGLFENLWRYGSIYPPTYNLNEVTVPVALFWGDNDPFANSLNTATLQKSLPNVILSYELPDITYNHMDFLTDKHKTSFLNVEILKVLEQLDE